MNTARKPSSFTARSTSVTASSTSNGDTIAAPRSLSGAGAQKSYIQSLYARAMAAANGGSMNGSASVCSPRVGKSTATSSPSTSIASNCTSGDHPRAAWDSYSFWLRS